MKTKPKPLTEEDLPAPGSVFLFPLEDGQYSIARVVRRITRVNPTTSTPKRQKVNAMVLVVTSSWVGQAAQTPSMQEIRDALYLTHHSWQNALQAVWIEDLPPPQFIPAQSIPVVPEDDALDSVSYDDWESLLLQPLLQWRWDHDRESVLQEEAAAKELVAQKAAAARKEPKPRPPTLAELANREWFKAWDTKAEAQPRKQSIALVTGLITRLQADPKPTKKRVKDELKQCTSAFNALEVREPFITTTHAEDIVEALHQISTACGYPDLDEFIDDQRDW